MSYAALKRSLPLVLVLASTMSSVAPASGRAHDTSAAQTALGAQTRAYLDVLDRYERGDREGAVEAAQVIDPVTAIKLIEAAIAEIHGRIETLARVKDGLTSSYYGQFRRDQLRILRVALLVHTETSLRWTSQSMLEPHLRLCQQIVSKIRGFEDVIRELGDDWSDQRAFIREWMLVVISHLQYLGDLGYLQSFVRAGLEMFGYDAELLLARGSLSESLAERALVDRSLANDIYTANHIQQWRNHLSASGGDYQAALRLQPGLHEAALRWGRVNRLLGDRKQARRQFEGVATGDAAPRLKYLARLFLGELAEHDNDFTAAEAEYRAALALSPTAQAPMLALSHLCDRRAEDACAKNWLRRSFDETGPERRDPWWGYRRGQGGLLAERLARFRARGLGR